MTPADRIDEPLEGIRIWSAFSPEHRVELGSSAVLTPEGWWVFDPIPIVSAPVETLFDRVAGIVLTNANHERDSVRWCDRFACRRWAAPNADGLPEGIERWTRSDPSPGWVLIPLPGGAPGETAFFRPDRSLLVVGDALVNLPGRGLEILPDKYCTNPTQLRRSLRHLPMADLVLTAHGAPFTGREVSTLLGISDCESSFCWDSNHGGSA